MYIVFIIVHIRKADCGFWGIEIDIGARDIKIKSWWLIDLE